MKLRLFAAATAALGLMAAASASTAAVTTLMNVGGVQFTITTTALSELGGYTAGLKPAGYTMIQDFDTGLAAGYSQTGLNLFPNPPNGGVGGAAAPPGDGTTYQSTQPGTPYTLTALGSPLRAFAFVMGSPDDGANFHNQLNLQVAGGPLIGLSGTNIWGGTTVYAGNQGAGFLINYTFNTAAVSSLSFSQVGQPAFEFDNISGVGVPEPTSWALMLLGFGGIGAALRSRRKAIFA